MQQSKNRKALSGPKQGVFIPKNNWQDRKGEGSARAHVCVGLLPAQAALCVDGALPVLAASVQEGSVRECAG